MSNTPHYVIIGYGAIGQGMEWLLKYLKRDYTIIRRGDYVPFEKATHIIDTAWEGANDARKRANMTLQHMAMRLAFERIEDAERAKFRGRYTMIGSQAEWGEQSLIMDSEFAHNHISDPYGLMKRHVCERLLSSALDSCWIRLSGVVYKEMPDSLFKRAATSLVDYDPDTLWNTLPLGTACEAILRITEEPEHGIINLGSPYNYTLRDMVLAAGGREKMHNENAKSRPCVMEVKRARRYVDGVDMLDKLRLLGKVWRGETPTIDDHLYSCNHYDLSKDMTGGQQ